MPAGTPVWEHEIRTAQAIAATGRTVEFLPRTLGKRVKNADIAFDGVRWEVKSPESPSVRSLQKTLRRAVKQSPNVVVDISMMRGVTPEAAMRELRLLTGLIKDLRRLKMVTRAGKSLTSSEPGPNIQSKSQCTVRKYLKRRLFCFWCSGRLWRTCRAARKRPLKPFSPAAASKRAEACHRAGACPPPRSTSQELRSAQRRIPASLSDAERHGTTWRDMERHRATRKSKEL